MFRWRSRLHPVLLVVLCASLASAGASSLGCGRARNFAHKVLGKLSSVRKRVTHEAERRAHHTDYHTRSPKPAIPLGVNVAGVNFYATSLPFVDLMKNAADFQTTNAAGGGAWDTQLADQIPRDDHRYPLELPFAIEGHPPQIVRASVGVAMYSGTYLLLYDGDGDFAFPAMRGKVGSRAPGRIELEIQASSETFFLSITRSSKHNHVRNVRLILPGFEATYATQPFHPRFLELLHGTSALRFVDWGRANETPLQHWEDRPLPDMPQGTRRGVAFENMIALANTLDADAWLCVPFLADEAFIEHLAELVKAQLDPRHKVYLEDSNEVWNPQFPQHDYAGQAGCQAGYNALPPNSGPCDAGGLLWSGVKWHAKRSADIFRIFQRVFGGEERLVRVLAGQAGFTELNEALLMAFDSDKLNPDHVHADALAIAPYFGGWVADLIVKKGEVDSISVDEIVARVQRSVVDQVDKPVAANKALADSYGLRLIAYEGGQSLVATGPNTRNDKLTQKLIEANRQPGMGEAYDHMLDAWYKGSGNDIMLLFNSVELPGRFGSWGMLESQLQPPETAPKYIAFHNRLITLAEAVH